MKTGEGVRSMKISRLPLFVLMLTLLCEPVFAQIGRNLVERGRDRKQIDRSKEWLVRDQAELQEFQKLVADLQAAVQSGEQENYTSLHAKLSEAMKRELEQSKVKADLAKKEVKQSSRELRSERRDVRESREADEDDEDWAELDRVRDNLQRGDDRRDRKDDVADLKQAGGRAQRQGQLLAQFTTTDETPTDDRAAAIASQTAIAKEFMKVLQADINATQIELKEDAAELKEDRRETRQDRRKRIRRND